ncbi:MerR family transcriptional regulator [Paenibacillus cellulositrophicus]|uniref:MerR family transcriptional regulator n=1 Tax=Paenibacillus cellulositrophicus TaxID=562959 RepID=UPI002041C04E|nr:MerR family transcriptional regulator [Paenibacillus cellulositrophicus]MCM2998561.1 MerR family transcriptional regulator [Paenibacillus cellulositrophicus]
MKISQLSKITGASIRSIRHYEATNLLTASRLKNGFREFDEASIERIKTIKTYLNLGLTTKQIEKTLKCTDGYYKDEAEKVCREMIQMYEEMLLEVNRKMNALAVVKQEMEEQVRQMKDSLYS